MILVKVVIGFLKTRIEFSNEYLEYELKLPNYWKEVDSNFFIFDNKD